MNIPFALIGNLSDQIKYQKEDRDWDETISESLAGMAATMSDQSFLQGVSRFFNWVNTGDKNYLKDFITQPLVPNIATFPKTLQQYATGDKPMYEAEGVVERVMRRIGMNEGLTKSYDAFGEVRQSGYERFPFNPSTLKDDKILNLLRKKDVTISRPSKTTKWGDKRMSDLPEVYAEYTRLSGKYLTEYLEKYKNRYEKLNGEQLQDFIDKLSRTARKKAKSDLKKRNK